MTEPDQGMTVVVIDTHGPTITVRANEPLATVLAAAIHAFDHAHAAYPTENKTNPGMIHGVGFHGDLRDTPPVQPSSMPWAPGQYPIQNGE